VVTVATLRPGPLTARVTQAGRVMGIPPVQPVYVDAAPSAACEMLPGWQQPTTAPREAGRENCARCPGPARRTKMKIIATMPLNDLPDVGWPATTGGRKAALVRGSSAQANRSASWNRCFGPVVFVTRLMPRALSTALALLRGPVAEPPSCG